MKKPLYEVVYDDISYLLQNGTYSPNDKLPSEKELEKKYSISKTPIRQALNKLENDGLIYRLQGRGSYASSTTSAERWTMTTGFGSQYSKEWKSITAKTIFINQIRSNKYSEKLKLSKESKIIHLQRVRYFNSKPLVYMEHYIRPLVPIDIFKQDENFITSAGKILKDYLDIYFTEIKEEIEAVIADEYIAKFLNVKVNYPILKINRFSYYKDKLIDINIYYVRTDKWKYHVKFFED